MVAPVTRSNAPNARLTLDDAVLAEIEALREAGDIGDGTITHPRCYVCAEVESKELVNKMLAAGLTNREIAESCRGINSRRKAAGDDRMIDARIVWNHRRNHFDVDAPLPGVVRSILERRAQERGLDYLNGVGHAVTPYAVLETTMVKGYQKRLADPEAEPPSLGETLSAAKTIHELTAKDASQRQMADLLTTMERIISAAEKFVPLDQREAFLAEVEGREYRPMQVLTERVAEKVDKAERAIKEFHAPRSMDEGDEI